MPSEQRPWSLRDRVLAIGAATGGGSLIAAGAAMFVAVDAEDQHLLDNRLAAMSEIVQAFAGHEIAEMRERGEHLPVTVGTHSLSEHYHYQIWSRRGELLLRTRGAPQGAPMRPLAERGFGAGTVAGQPHRTFVLDSDDNGGMVIQVAELLASRDAAVDTVGAYFLALLAAPIAVIIAVNLFLLKLALSSFDQVAEQLRQRGPLDPTPVQARHPPTELRPMLDAINDLVSRLAQALSIERNFTEQAAHELRTLLAAARGYAQLAASADTPQQAVAALKGMMSSIDHVNHLQTQLLDLASSDSLQGQAHLPVNLSNIYHHVMVDLGPPAAQRQIAIVDRFEAAEVRAASLGMHLLMHNLLMNAVRYAPSGGRVHIASSAVEGGVLLTVDDSGPGIPAPQRERALERFERLGRGDGQGLGLGLSIVRSVAAAHDATVRLLDSPLGGLRVEVRFPAALPQGLHAGRAD